MRALKLLVVLILVMIMQTVILPFVRVFGVVPDLILLITASVGLLYGSRDGAVVGVAGGLLFDLLHGDFVGLSVFSKMITGYACGLLSDRIFKDNVLVPLVVAVGATILDQVAYLVAGKLVGQTLPVWPGLYRVVLPMALYDAVLGPFVFAWIHNLTKPVAKLPGRGPRGLL